MLSGLLQAAENKNAALRLREMVTVLRRHDIVHGLTRRNCAPSSRLSVPPS